MRTFSLAVAAALTVCGATNAVAGTYFYVVDGISVDPARGGCSVAAGTIAADFASLTGLDVTRTICAQRSDGLDNIRITYTADEEAPLVTTNDEANPLQDPGRYSTYAACAADIAAEKAYFEAQTGLRAIIAYCKPMNEMFRDSWLLRIDSFGTPALAPHYTGMSVSDQPVTGDLNTLKANVEGLMRAHGKDVRWLNMKTVAGTHDITIQYYGSERSRLRSWSYGRVRDLAQCENEKAALNDALAALDIGSTLTFCGRSITGNYGVWGVTVDGPIGFVRHADERFGSYQECDLSREDVVAHYQTTRSATIVGGICSYEDFSGQWRMSLVAGDEDPT